MDLCVIKGSNSPRQQIEWETDKAKRGTMLRVIRCDSLCLVIGFRVLTPIEIERLKWGLPYIHNSFCRMCQD